MLRLRKEVFHFRLGPLIEMFLRPHLLHVDAGDDCLGPPIP